MDRTVKQPILKLSNKVKGTRGKTVCGGGGGAPAGDEGGAGAVAAPTDADGGAAATAGGAGAAATALFSHQLLFRSKFRKYS